MLDSIPAKEMAETLRVLAGVNAANAARHFCERSQDLGDAAGAMLWTSIGAALELPPFAATAPAEQSAGPPIPQRMRLLLEVQAYRGERFHDVDDDLLIHERLQEILEAEKDAPAGNVHHLPEPQPVSRPQVETPEGADRRQPWSLPLAA
jgi:hypothetical protein